MSYSSPVLYRLYQPDDFAALYAIEEASFTPPLRFSRRYMRALVKSPNTATWIAEDDAQLAAFAVVEWAAEPDGILAYIPTIEVAPLHRRRGIAAQLLQRIEDSAQSAGAILIWLHVDARNTAAIALYESRAYLQQGSEEDFYPHGHPALVYVKALVQPPPSAASTALSSPPSGGRFS